MSASITDPRNTVVISETGVEVRVVGVQGPAGSGSGGGVTDHGALTGLADDDHTQYHNDARGDARYYTQAQVDVALAGKAAISHTHAAGDITSGTLADARIAQSNVTQHQAALSIASTQVTGTKTSGYISDFAESVDDRVAALLVAGSNVTLTYNDGANTLTIAASVGGGVSDGDKGDITVSASGATWVIDNDVVTFAKMQNISTGRILGRTTASSGDVEELSAGSNLSLSGGVLNLSNNPVVNSISTANFGMSQLDSGGDHYLTFGVAENLTANRNLSFVTGDAARTLTFAGNATVGRTITGTTNVITVTNGDGVSGNPTITVGSLVMRTDTAQEHTKAHNFDATTLSDGANISWNLDDNQVASVTLAGNRTLDNPTNMRAGGTYILIVKQDGTGSRTLSFGTNYKWPAGTAPTLSTGANDVDVLTFVSDGTNMYGVAQKDFS